jgi:LysR family transcriptional regulator (chromosome initiation inhibitor)
MASLWRLGITSSIQDSVDALALLSMQVDLEQLRALSAAVATGTLDAAARELHVTPSAVSQRLRALETATGRVLLVRSKPVRATESGEAVLRLARQVELLVADCARELGAGAVTPALGVAVNADSLATWVLPALAPLGDAIALHLRREDEANTTALLRAGAVVAAVTADPVAVAGCSVTALGAMRYRPMAAPGFAAQWFADGATADTLARAPVVVFDRDDPLQHAYLERAAPGAAPPLHMVPSSADFVAAIGLGMGWGMVPDLQAWAPGAPALTEIDPAGTADVALYWQQWRLRSASLDRLADAIVAGARARLLAEA